LKISSHFAVVLDSRSRSQVQGLRKRVLYISRAAQFKIGDAAAKGHQSSHLGKGYNVMLAL
jgi:hypothetical protein